MSLTPGTKIGPYEILSIVGEGGMGAVYKARDTRLDRVVAIKTLLPGREVTEDMRQRFQSEARAISRLNHPHVCTLHDVGRDAGIDYLVLEFVDAKPLDRVIPKAGMRLNEILSIGWQIADALAAAHKAGIVHRDLKPGNVMVNETGQVKVLDFGLAKLEEIAQRQLAADDRTLTQRHQTSEGTILGTVFYMSPEQAEGKPVDARSDIFSFGVLMYEMATGRRPFGGDTKMATVGAILNQEPKPLNEDMPLEFRRMIERCLRKVPGRRVQHMDDVRVLLEDLKEDSASGRLATNTSVTAAKPRALPKALVVGSLVAAVLAAGAVWSWIGDGRPAELRGSPAVWKQTPLTSLPGIESSPTFSPDASQVAFSWPGETGDNSDIYVKVIGTDKPLRLTTHSALDLFPAWSPDGRWIAFTRFRGDEGQVVYYAIPPTGGPERKLAETKGTRAGSGGALGRWMAMAWTPDSKGVVITECETGALGSFLVLVSLESGQRMKLTNPQGPITGDSAPDIAPDGSLLAFTRFRQFGGSDIFLQRLVQGFKPAGEPRRITSPPGQFQSPMFLPNRKELIYRVIDSKNGSGLFRMAVDDPSTAVSMGLPEAAIAAVSRDGTRLAFQYSGAPTIKISRLTLENGKGRKAVPFLTSSRADQAPRYSPDGTRIAFESERSGDREIWVANADGAGAVQVTSSRGPNTSNAIWSPDGKQIAFASFQSGEREVYTVSADGGAVSQVTRSGSDVPSSWSSDGMWIYVNSRRSGRGEVWRIRPDGTEPTQVTRDGGGGARESIDGKTLVVRMSGLRRFPLVAGMPSGTGVDLGILKSGAAGYDVAKNGIYFALTGDTTISYLDFATLRVTPVWTVPSPNTLFFGLSVSPDEKSLLFVTQAPRERDLVLIENFR